MKSGGERYFLVLLQVIAASMVEKLNQNHSLSDIHCARILLDIWAYFMLL
jgi:hypothetical protein